MSTGDYVLSCEARLKSIQAEIDAIPESERKGEQYWRLRKKHISQVNRLQNRLKQLNKKDKGATLDNVMVAVVSMVSQALSKDKREELSKRLRQQLPGLQEVHSAALPQEQ